MFAEYLIFNMTMQFDLNPISEGMPPSFIHINGIHKENMKYADEPGDGVVYIPNHQDDGEWLITLDDFKVSQESVFLEFANTSCPAVLATALNSIKMPESDF